MTTYGISRYGPPNLYGPGLATQVVPGGATIPLVNNAYLVDPFTAVPLDYASTLLTWTSPVPGTGTPMTEFRLLSSRYGFPVDENDGNILIDSTTVPANQYVDQNVIPGQMIYYGFYINSGTAWVRSGFAACLMPVNNGYGATLLSYLPEYIRDLSTYELTASNVTPTSVLAPPVPASGYTLTSPYPYPVQVTLSTAPTDVVVDGVDLGYATQFWVASNGTITMTYTGAISWTWLNIPPGNVNPYIQQFLNVAGWSVDFLKTQYDYTFNTLNNPMQMPLDELMQLALQLGIPYQAEIPAYFMRKATANWATVMKERGSLTGVSEHISLLTGYGADIHLSNNIMLENDQSSPLHPVWPAWSANTPYVVGERVTYPTYAPWSDAVTYITGNAVDYNGVYYQYTGSGTTTEIPPSINGTVQTGWTTIQGPYVYQCLTAITSLPGTAPSGTTTSTSTWELVYDKDDTASLLEITGLLGGVNTWETVYPTQATTYSPPAGSLVAGLGVPNPLNFDYDYTQNSIRAYNKGSATQNLWVRSLSRESTDLTSTNTNLVPDPQTVIEHAIPVPIPGPEWTSTTEYGTGDVVSYLGRNFLALRGSTNVVPNATQASNEWVVLGTGPSIPLMASAYISQSLSTETAETFAITPFVEWYDSWGNFIARVFASTPTAGTAGVPSNYFYDGFYSLPNTALNGRELDTNNATWTTDTGGWTVDGHGQAYPTVAGETAIATVTVPSTGVNALTFASAAGTSTSNGLVVWYKSSTSYFHAGMSALYYNNAGTWITVGTYSSALEPGDRLYVETNYSTPSITVYKNSLTSTAILSVPASAFGSTVPSGAVPSSTSGSGIAAEAI